MSILLGIIYGIILVALVMVLGMRPQASPHSRFELNRRSKNGNEHATRVLKRLDFLPDIFSLQRVTVAVLLVILSVLGVNLFHWAVGLLVSLLIALEAGAIARLPLIQKYSQQVYERFEMTLLRCIERHRLLFATIRNVSPTTNYEVNIGSKEELLDIVSGAGEVLTRDETAIVKGGIEFDERQVGQVMTPRSVIESISSDEVLGPLVLDDLHKTGYSRFPVTDKDIDHIVGILHIQDLFVVSQQKKTQKASQAMEKKVYYIREDQTLRHALNGFLRTRHHLFIVVNAYRETVGLVSLEDVIESLIGRKINDEFDVYDDLRKVAAQNLHKNNSPKSHQDI